MNYVKIPGYDAGEKIDPTFIASVFTGTLATLAFKREVRRRKVIVILAVLTYLKRIWSSLLLKHLKLHPHKLSGLNQVL